MKIKKQRFALSNESEFDTRVLVRTFAGNLTEARREKLDLIARRYTESHSHPYGISPNGYAYTCGHEWDCCGCLIHDFMEVEYTERCATIKIIQTFNY
jgi:hypothetical protein